MNKSLLALLLILSSVSICHAATIEINVSTATGTGTGTLPGDIQTDDNVYYSVAKGSQNVQVTNFNVAGQTGAITSVVLHVRYLVTAAYTTGNSFQASFNNGTTWNTTTITPTAGQTAEADYSYTIPGLTGWPLTGTLDVRFINGNSGGGTKTVSIDRIWLLVTYIACGDALCQGSETYATCPQDCCDADCSSTTDTTCHTECQTYNGCSFFDATARTVIFQGEIISGLGTTTYKFMAPMQPGTYFFRCDVHPATMTGSFIVQ